MDDEQEAGPDDRTLAELIEQTEAEPKAEAEEEDEPGTEDEAEGATEDAGKAGDEEAKGDEDKDEKSDEDDQPKQKRLSGSERLKRRLAAAEAELGELRRGVSRSGEVTKEAIAAEIGEPPKEADFKGDFLAYERALTAYELDARQAARELRKGAERAKQASAEAMRDAAEAHAERIEEFAEKVPDFKAVLQKASHLKASPAVEMLVLESEQSAHLVYHLAKTPELLEKLNRMSEREAAREIGRVEARLSLPKPKTETKAPKPVSVVKGGASPISHDQQLNAWLKETYKTAG